MDLPETKDLKGQFENEILPEAEIVIMPYKLKGMVRLEIMNDDLAALAIKEGVIESDLINDISRRKTFEILTKLTELIPKLKEKTA